MYYYAYLFPAIRMSKTGNPIEKMTSSKGANGVIEKWNAASASSSAMSRKVERSFRSDGYNLLTFPELLARSQPYSVLVVSTFYTSSLPLKDAKEGGPDRTVTIKIKGALFGLDLDPAKSQAVGTVLCTGFYSSKKDNVQKVTDKLLDEAVRNLGKKFNGSGVL